MKNITLTITITTLQNFPTKQYNEYIEQQNNGSETTDDIPLDATRSSQITDLTFFFNTKDSHE